MHNSNEGYFRNIQIADKFVRTYRHRCLVPLCEEKAIRSHAIQRAAIEKALAVGGHVYTLNPSFLSMLNTDPRHCRDIKKISSRKSGTFPGFCAEHDNKLFLPIETPNDFQRRNMQTALYVRAMSLECSRKRNVALFFEKLFELEQSHEARGMLKEFADSYRHTADIYYRKLLAPMLRRSLLDRFKKIDFLVIPFPGNLEVSCAGVFNVDVKNYKSIIAYNLISYPDMSFLSLTARKSRSNYIDVFISQYQNLRELEKMVNDIAFLKGEEPLISPRLWNSISLGRRKKIAQSLVHPDFRTMNDSIDIIRLPKDASRKMQEKSFYQRIGIEDEVVSNIVRHLKT